MAQTQPPNIDPVPTPPIQRGDRATFSSRVDAFIIWLVNAVPQFRALATNVYNNTVDASQSASLSASKATAASDSATAANTSAGSAANSASAAATSASNAASSATDSANSALALTATSTTSNTLNTGNKTFTVQAGKQFIINGPITAVDATNSGNRLNGYVVSYSGTSLVINATTFEGSGSSASWNITVSGTAGARGATGSLSGANMTGPLNFAKGSDVASATSTNIWNATGNLVNVTGTETITSFTNAPQAGSSRRLIAAGAFTLASGPNLIVKGVASGTSFTVSPGDEIDVYAETPTLFRVTVNKGDGTAMAALYGSFQNTLIFPVSATFTAKKTGWHRITLTGSGGRGGAAAGNGQTAVATGGGAGGLCIGMRFLVAGRNYVIGVGSGVPTLGAGAGQAIQGAAGSASTFSGADIVTMTANGGGPGSASINSTAALAGGIGGSASGGDFNYSGGNGGAVSGILTGSPSATGGGAVALQGVSYSAGDITATSSSSGTSSGGAGVGGKAGDVTVGARASGGGGSGGASGIATSTTSLGGVNYARASGLAAPGTVSALMNATGEGANANSGINGLNGGGGGGATSGTTSSSGGVFAGGGGTANIQNSGATGGNGGQYGGGSGGGAVVGVGGAAGGGMTQSGLAMIEF